MNLKTTLLLLVVVAVLGALALKFGDDPGGAPAFTNDSSMLVQNLPGGRAVKFEVLLASQQDATCERRGEDWWITSPFTDRASPDAVRQLMEALKSNPRLEVEAAPSRETLEALRLEPPLTRVSLWGTEGEPIRIRIGERDATGAFTSALIEGDPALYRTGANLVNVLAKGRHEWRDRRFLTGDAALLRRVELKRPGEPTVVFERPGTDWMLVEPTAFQANDSAIQPLVNGLLLLQVERFAKLAPQEKDLADAGITEATQIEVSLDWGAHQVTARFGPPEGGDPAGRRYGVDSERGHLFVVKGEALAGLSRRATEFRDPRVIRVTPGNVARVRFARPGEPTIDISFDAAERALHLVEPFEAPVDDSRESALRGWMLQLSALVAESYLDRSELGEAPDGGDAFALLFEESLGTLDLAVARRGGAGARPVSIEFADGGDVVYVRRADLAPDTIYLVSKAAAAEVLALDPRQLMTRDLFPTGMLAWKEATVRHGGRERRIVRDTTRNAEYWRDPDAPDTDTSDFQQYLSALEGTGVLEFLPRDPVAEDGLSDDDAAVVSLRIATPRGGFEELVARFGAVDPTETTVVGTASGSACGYPPRTVFRAEEWLRTHLVALFD